MAFEWFTTASASKNSDGRGSSPYRKNRLIGASLLVNEAKAGTCQQFRPPQMSNKVENLNQNSRGKSMSDDSNPDSTLPRYSVTRNLHRADFFYDAPQARQVSLVVDFNDCHPEATPMARQSDGRWMVSLELTHGYH